MIMQPEAGDSLPLRYETQVVAQPVPVELVELARRGDQAAFARLVELYWPAIHAYLLRLTGESELAADLTQETFFNAYKAIGRFSPEKALFRAWLYRIATNLAVSHFRRKKGRHWLSLDKAGPDAEELTLPDDQPGPADRSLAAENSREVVALLAGLPPEQVSLLLLRFYHEMDYSEIAQVLQIRPDAVRARVHRARLAFARRYQQYQKESQ